MRAFSGQRLVFVLAMMAAAIGLMVVASGSASEPVGSGPLGLGSATLAMQPVRTDVTAQRALAFAGKFHVVVIHFPIALVALAAIGDGLFLLLRSEKFAAASRVCVVGGGISAVVATLLGWALSTSVRYTESLTDVLELHRWIGTAAGAWSLVILALLAASQRSSRPAVGYAYRAALYFGSALIGAAAHLGGTLVYGPDHFTW